MNLIIVTACPQGVATRFLAARPLSGRRTGAAGLLPPILEARMVKPTTSPAKRQSNRPILLLPRSVFR